MPTCSFGLRSKHDSLREKGFDELDLGNLVDEVESVGKSQRSAVENRLVVLLVHLLKCARSPVRVRAVGGGAIIEQRRRLARAITLSPSLRDYPAEVFIECYLAGRLQAAAETGIDFTLFPEQPPFTVEQALDDSFLPKQPDLYDQS